MTHDIGAEEATASDTPVESKTQEDVPTERKLVVTDRRRYALLIAVLVLGGLAIIAFLILGFRTFNLRLEAARKLDNATTLVQDSDEVVVRIDEVVRAKVEPDLAERARGAIERVDDADKMLVRAVALIDAARLDLNDDEREQADLLKASAVARRTMLEPAPEILDANAEAASALPLAIEGWKSVLEADRLSDDAVASYNKLTKAGVQKSQKLNKQASSVLSTARERFESAETAFPAGPFEDYVKYVEVRIVMNRLSQRSDTKWLDGDITAANKVIGDYNKQDKKAVALAKKLPPSPEKAVSDAYQETTDAVTDEYYEAREKALAADKALREH